RSTFTFRIPNPHRIRGTIFRICDPASPERAEEAYLAAVSVARQGGARSFELRAALALAKLYKSTGRPAEAHTVLAPALEGFAPTAEMPEIAEAQVLLAAVDSDVVNVGAAYRRGAERTGQFLGSSSGTAALRRAGLSADG